MWPDRNGSEDEQALPRVITGLSIGLALLGLVVKVFTTWLDAEHGHLNAASANLILYAVLGLALLAAGGFLVRRRLRTGSWGPKDDRPVRRRWPPP